MMATLILFAHIASALVVMYACFCRLSKTTIDTYATVRFAIWMMGSVAAIVLAAPFLWGWLPDIFHVVLLGAIGFLQVITSRQWRHGVPDRFQRAPLCTRH